MNYEFSISSALDTNQWQWSSLELVDGDNFLTGSVYVVQIEAPANTGQTLNY